MAKKHKKAKRDESGIVTLKLKHKWAEKEITGEARTDLVFEGVHHTEGSYELRAYANNEQANESTPRDIDFGYVGRFVIFGHGGCFGQDGHCNFSTAVFDPRNPERSHPVRPLTRYLTLRTELVSTMAEHDSNLKTLTLIPLAAGLGRKRLAPDASVFEFSSVSLRVYE